MVMNSTGLSGFQVSTAMLWPMLTGLRAMCADLDAICRRAGVSLAELEDPSARIPFESAVRLSLASADEVGDPAFGLHLAERYSPGMFGLLDYLAQSSQTLGQAIRHLCRYNRLLQDAAETRLELVGERAVIWQELLGGVWLPPGVVENSMANLVVIGRAVTGSDLRPIEVQFRHPPPVYAAEHDRIFRTRVRFDAERDAVVLRAEDLDLPVTKADSGLCSVLDRHARQLLESQPRVALFSARVRKLCACMLRDGAPTAVRVARELRISERTLRRRLKKEWTTFEELVDELRRGLTQHYLDFPEMTLEQIALSVGYSEAGAFRRAFRRWYGTSPADFRRRREAGKVTAQS
jgi:AraC-like DNA-binding protein